MGKNALQLAGRVLIATVFVFSIIGQVGNFSAMEAYMANFGMHFTGFFLTASLVVRAAGSLSIILGYQTRWGAALLSLFLIPTTLIFHTQFSQPSELIAFLENLSLLGGLLLLGAAGPGELSFDERRKAWPPARKTGLTAASLL